MRPWLRPETAAAAAAAEWLAGEDGAAADLEEWWLTAAAAAAAWGAECWWCADLSFELRRSANDVFVGGQNIGGGGGGGAVRAGRAI